MNKGTKADMNFIVATLISRYEVHSSQLCELSSLLSISERCTSIQAHRLDEVLSEQTHLIPQLLPFISDAEKRKELRNRFNEATNLWFKSPPSSQERKMTTKDELTNISNGQQRGAGMTVSELIADLQKLPQDICILVAGYYVVLHSVRLSTAEEQEQDGGETFAILDWEV